MSWRELRVLVEGLPPGSCFGRAVGGAVANWTDEKELLAGIFDGIRAGNWQRGGGKGGEPPPYPRPK